MKYKHSKEDFMQMFKESNLGLSEEQIEGISELLVTNNALCLPYNPGSTMYGIGQRTDGSYYAKEVKGITYEIFDGDAYLYDEDGVMYIPGCDIFPTKDEVYKFVEEAFSDE